ncbi:NADPH-dependent F420 reductase [Haliangium ochraceum]|uniref:NADP oxidoreductase coenzyme F420-dependent n=1 Tax=Haliangium ochraceum (strain DSM 14365 / JCM 11303 / SMP-2) TaxID=502025 RepID=D0LFZ8_HALO1|nr:NAD(P)-binding domain-containing protein [Haliangium ochraceum]ACY14600.1 NADP oxidoreductase coenzyme F420-dependent [Haliangium ochraceum DSM 14365]
MKIGIFGTGMVGKTIASKLVALGHDVMMGARSASNESAAAWAAEAGAGASHGTFADAAGHGEIVFCAVNGAVTMDVIAAAGSAIDGKLLLDITNPLDFSQGMPPSSLTRGEDSLAERIQRAHPTVKVVKTLNTMNCDVMVDPSRVPGEHAVFVSGDDAEAKKQVENILRAWFGWKQVIDLGDLSTARGTEAYVLMWLRMWGALGTTDFNIQIVRAPQS